MADRLDTLDGKILSNMVLDNLYTKVFSRASQMRSQSYLKQMHEVSNKVGEIHRHQENVRNEVESSGCKCQMSITLGRYCLQKAQCDPVANAASSISTPPSNYYIYLQ